VIPHLNRGLYGDAAILSPVGMQNLLRPAGPKENVDEAYAMDWGHMTLDGERLIMKGGDLADFKTQVVLIPDARGAVVTLMNTNDSLGSTLGDLRVPFIPIGVTKILLGKEVPPAPTSSMPVVYRGIPAVIVALLLLGILLSAFNLRRWRSTPARRPSGFWHTSWHIALPFVVYLGLGLLAVLGVPSLLHLPVSFLQYMFPDFGYAIYDIGVIGIGWSLVWLALVIFVLHRAAPSAAVPDPRADSRHTRA